MAEDQRSNLIIGNAATLERYHVVLAHHFVGLK